VYPVSRASTDSGSRRRHSWGQSWLLVTVTTFPLKVGTLTVTLLSCSASATFVPADIDLRMLPLSSGVPVALAKERVLLRRQIS
jgi:hypothetical protein